MNDLSDSVLFSESNACNSTSVAIFLKLMSRLFLVNKKYTAQPMQFDFKTNYSIESVFFSE